MKQNIYDDERFYELYANLRAKSAGLNDVLEIPAFRTLLPNLNGKRILDLGCGFGDSCKWYASQGAKQVVGADISQRMIHRAERDFADAKIEYRCIAMEDADFHDGEFDLVLSSLAFHYVADFDTLIKKITRWLKPGGFLIFSQEHPIATAKKIPEGWVKNESGEKMHWILDHYHDEGIRWHHWLVQGVVKYHRTLASMMNCLMDNGLNLVRILEPTAAAAAAYTRG